MEAVPFRFLGLSDEESAYKTARIVIIPVPFEGTVTYGSGTARGPRALIDASRQVELFDDEFRIETYQAGIHTLDEWLVPADPEAVIDQVERKVARVLEDGKLPVVIGGEHSVSLGAVRACAKRYGELSVLQFDAHADLRDSYCGTRYSHACVGARIAEVCPLVQVGIRSLSRAEWDRTNQGNVKTFFKSEFWLRTHVVDQLSEKVYVTFDLDYFDPAALPGTGTPEPGGYTWPDATALLRNVIDGREIIGFDVVELSPIPGNVVSEFTAAKLVYRILGYLAYVNDWVEPVAPPPDTEIGGDEPDSKPATGG